MNFAVHSVMYSYYLAPSAGLRGFVRPLAPLITLAQIAQMVVGLAVTATVARRHAADPRSCHTVAANWKLAFGMCDADRPAPAARARAPRARSPSLPRP